MSRYYRENPDEPIRHDWTGSDQAAGTGGSFAPPKGSALTVEQMLTRLATRGLVPCEHNITIWQFADGTGNWGVAVDAPYTQYRTKAEGRTIEEALYNLMCATNRGADVVPNDKLMHGGKNKGDQ